MTRIELSKNGSSPFEKLIGHNEEILNNWNLLEKSLFEKSSLSNELLEQVRRTLALDNECEYCIVKAGLPNEDLDNKTSLAVAFAQMYANNHKNILDEHFDILKEEFSTKEISELCSFISFISSCQKLGHIYNLTQEYQENRVCDIKDVL